MKNSLFVIVFITFFFACGKEEVVELPSNNIPPENNDLIISQKVFDTSSKKMQFNEIVNSGDGNLYYRKYEEQSGGGQSFTVIVGGGGGNTDTNEDESVNYRLGKLSASGNILWEREPGFRPRNLYTINHESGVLQNSLLAGGQNNNGTGRLTLYDSQGNSIKNYTYNDVNLWINDIKYQYTSGNNVYFTAFGGGYLDNIPYPAFFRFYINKANGEITPVSFQRLSNLPNKYGVSFVIADNNYYTIIKDGTDNNSEYYTHIYSINANNYNVNWTHKINASGINSDTQLNTDIQYSQGKLYLASNIDDPSKEEPSNGGYWNSIVVTALSTNGSLLWENNLNLTQSSDETYSCFLQNNQLYIIGRHSGYCSNDCQNHFANALIVKVNLNTGGMDGIYTFGDKHSYYWINQAIFLNNSLFVAGGANWNGESYQGWLAEINLN